jgi:hypothetical protein
VIKVIISGALSIASQCMVFSPRHLTFIVPSGRISLLLLHSLQQLPACHCFNMGQPDGWPPRPYHSLGHTDGAVTRLP